MAYITKESVQQTDAFVRDAGRGAAINFWKEVDNCVEKKYIFYSFIRNNSYTVILHFRYKSILTRPILSKWVDG